MIIALVVVVVLFGGVILFAVVGLVALGAKSEMDTLAGAIARGDLPGLTPFSDHVLPWLSKDLVGHSSYVRPMGGALTGSLAATVPSCEGPATLLALRTELTPRRGQGRIDLLAGGPRIELQLHEGLWFVSANGRPLGTIDPSSGRLDDSNRRTVGWHQRVGGSSSVHLFGAHLATIDAGASLHEQRPAAPRPLLRLTTLLPNAEASMWLLAVLGLDLGLALTPTRGGGAMMGVP